jgi:hypothetical protein
MSCPGDNYVVPGANPCDQNNNQGGGNVESIIAGDGIIIDPINGLGNVTINAVAAVDTISGLIGNVGVISDNGTITISNIGNSINFDVTNPPPVTSLIAGTGITLSPESGLGNVTINANAPPSPPVTLLIAGTNIVLDPISGLGAVTINALDAPPAPVTSLVAGTGITLSPTSGLGNVTINASVPSVYSAQYYKTTAQNLTSGNTDITFDGTSAWNLTGGYITHTNGTTDFTVVQSGVYQLEFNATILINNGTWPNTSNKNIAIDITRPSLAEQTVLTNSALMGNQSYAQSICGTYYLVAGDIINLRIGNTFTFTVGTPPQVQQFLNTFDLNTFFTWRFIK